MVLAFRGTQSMVDACIDLKVNSSPLPSRRRCREEQGENEIKDGKQKLPFEGEYSVGMKFWQFSMLFEDSIYIPCRQGHAYEIKVWLKLEPCYRVSRRH